MRTALILALVTLLSSVAPAHSEGNRPMPKVIVFDVNETLLDLTAMRTSVAEALGGRNDLLPLWFSTMLHYSLVETTSGNYRDFADVGAAALVMTAEREGIDLDLETARTAIVTPITALPAHADVVDGLRALREKGFTLVSLTNSSNAGVKAQFEFAGLTEFFDRRFSTEDVDAFKPDPRPYRYVLSALGIEPQDALMVAAHAWDLHGAKAVGLQTAFLQRPGAAAYPHAEAPDYSAKDLQELAALLSD